MATAEGEPGSVERRADVEALLADVRFVMPNAKVLKGESVLSLELLDLV